MADGFLDTNVFVHALLRDDQSEECQRFLATVQEGRNRARLDPLVMHELSYVLPRVIKQMDRAEVADFLEAVLGWKGIDADRTLLAEALRRWRVTTELSFVDAVLCAAAGRERLPIYTKNVRHFANQGVDVPNPLPGTEMNR